MAGVDVGTAYLTVVPSAKGFSANLTREIGGGMTSAGAKAGDSAAKGFGTRFKSGIATVAKAGALGLAAAFAGGVAFAKDAIGEAREAQKVGAVTEQIIKATGGAAKVSAAQVGDLATAISNKTGMDDEAIQSGANLLLTFKNVRNEVGQGANVFDRATQAAVDLSAAGFGDVNNASKMLGKALNDPVKGLTALGRAGVQFTDQQKKQIKTLTESGKTLDAQKIILKEVESQVGGTGAASATMGEKLSVSFGNFKEKIGTALLPMLDKVQAWLNDEVIPAMSKFVDEFQSGTGAGGEFRDRLAEVVEKVKDAAKWIAENKDKLAALVVTVTSAVAIFQAVKLAVNAWKVAQLALNVVLMANPIGLVVAALALLVAGVIYAYNESETFRNVVDTALKGIASAWRWLWNTIIAPIIRFILNGFADMTGGIASFLRALSNIPGFGWAKDAADKMQGASDKARGLARGILDIPSDKTITITVQARANDLAIRAMNLASSGGSSKATAMITGRASGGPVYSGGMYAVGDNPDGSWNATTELFVPKQAGTVFTQSQLAGMGGGGGLSDADIARLAAAVRDGAASGTAAGMDSVSRTDRRMTRMGA